MWSPELTVMPTLLSVGLWAGDPGGPLLPALFHGCVATCPPVPSKTKGTGTFQQAALTSWATATSLAISCSISSGVGSQRGNLTWWRWVFGGAGVCLSLLNRQRVF